MKDPIFQYSTIFLLMQEVVDSLRKQLCQVLTPEHVSLIFGLSKREFRALVMMNRLLMNAPEGLPLKEVSDVLGMNFPNTSVVVGKLVDLGLFDRQPNPNDKRSFLIVLSEMGKENFKKVLELMDKCLSEYMKGSSIEQQKIFFQVLLKIHGSINKSGKEY